MLWDMWLRFVWPCVRSSLWIDITPKTKDMLTVRVSQLQYTFTERHALCRTARTWVTNSCRCSFTGCGVNSWSMCCKRTGWMDGLKMCMAYAHHGSNDDDTQSDACSWHASSCTAGSCLLDLVRFKIYRVDAILVLLVLMERWSTIAPFWW